MQGTGKAEGGLQGSEGQAGSRGKEKNVAD